MKERQQTTIPTAIRATRATHATHTTITADITPNLHYKN
jgi:hypothetical protein